MKIFLIGFEESVAFTLDRETFILENKEIIEECEDLVNYDEFESENFVEGYINLIGGFEEDINGQDIRESLNKVVELLKNGKKVVWVSCSRGEFDIEE